MLPNVECPHCKKTGPVQVSGYSGKLAIREKDCRFCGKIFFVHMLIETSKEKDICDGEITSLKQSIKALNKERKKTYLETLIKHNIAKKINQEAINIAEDMHRKRQLN